MSYWWKVWESWGAEPWVVQVLKEGYSLPFLSRPRLSSTPVPLPSYSPSSVRGLTLTAAVADLQSKGAIESASSEPGFYSRLFVTPKVTGGWRPVIDLSRLNRFVRLSPFRMEMAQPVLQSLCPGDWMVSLDLQDAYLQVPVHPDLRRYLRFCIGPRTFQFRALCFGLSSAPQVFTHVMAPISSIMHHYGFRILRYLDNWLVLGSSREEIARARAFLLSLCDQLMVLVNLDKSFLHPSQTIDYLGMSLHTSPLRAFPTQTRIQKVLSLISELTSSPAHPLPLWRSLLGVMSSLTPLIPGARLRMRSLQLRLRIAGPQQSDLALISWDDLPPGSSVVVRCQSSRGRRVFGPASSAPPPVHRRVRYRFGSHSRRRPLVRLVDSGHLVLFHQPSRAPSSSVCAPGFPSSSLRPVCVPLHRQHFGSCLPPQARGHQVGDSQFGGPIHSLPLQGQRCSSAPPVCAGEAQCNFGLPQPRFPGVGIRMDSVSGGLPGSFPPLAGHYRPVRHLHEPPASSLFLPGGGSPSPAHRRHEPVLRRPPGLCLSSVRIHSECPCQDPPVSESGGHTRRPVLASEAVVPGHPGTSSGCPDPSTAPQVLAPATPFPSFSLEPPRSSHDWVSYSQRTVRHLGFSSAVAGQLAFCRRSSTRMNYQARWLAYRAWCRRQGHSISHPTISKIADFLLYLRRSLHLSNSSIVSYRSMLNAVYRFILPDVSSHPVLHDLLRSFRIERPLPSSRVPPWDLLRVLSLLRGPPFEPLSSCSLRDLTRKVLFLVALATARRVGELQAVSSSVSYSGEDLYLSYLPEFRAKTESASNPLPRSFAVRLLRDFVGSLPDELLLCPVRALCIYVSHTSTVSPRPRSLFVSPRTPTRPLSKNALSYFLRSVILQSLPPPPTSSSSVRAHTVRSVSSSAAFSRNVALPDILAAATWHSSTVFTSSYLRDVQFTSDTGFALCPVVAAGAVV